MGDIPEFLTKPIYSAMTAAQIARELECVPIPVHSAPIRMRAVELLKLANGEPSVDQVLAAQCAYDNALRNATASTGVDRFIAMQEAIKAAFS